MAGVGLNIISFDVPYPPDYGGVIDIFYKIRTLHRLRVSIHLHCFEYGERGRREELAAYCTSVHYYPRKTGLSSNLSLLPYITYSRRSRELLDNLRTNDYPILCEGIHSTYLLLGGKLRDRSVSLRSHNIEHDYYLHLARREAHPVRKLYFRLEAYRLKRLLSKLPANLSIAAISPADTTYLQQHFRNTFWLPPFHSNDAVTSLTGTGDYALYHGNLSVSENYEVAQMLIASFRGKNIQLIVAGKAPPPALRQAAANSSNIQLIADPDETSMDELLRQAHVVLLPTYQATGIKLKLIESLYRGRFCIANDLMVAGTGLEDAVIVENNDFYDRTKTLMGRSLTEAAIAQRKATMLAHFSNLKNAQLLLEVGALNR